VTRKKQDLVRKAGKKRESLQTLADDFFLFLHSAVKQQEEIWNSTARLGLREKGLKW